MRLNLKRFFLKKEQEFSVELIEYLNEAKDKVKKQPNFNREKIIEKIKKAEEVMNTENSRITKEVFTSIVDDIESLFLEEERFEDSKRTLLLNINMLINETKVFLNTNTYYPKPLLFKAQDLENTLTLMKNLKAINREKYIKFETEMATFKRFLEETKSLHTEIKSIDAPVFDKQPKRMNEIILGFQKGEFESVRKQIKELESY